DKVGFLRGAGQLPVEQQITGFEKIAVFGKVGDRITAIEQNALVAVDIGDLGFAAPGGGETGIVGEYAGLGIKLADVQHLRPDRAVKDGKQMALVAGGDWAGLDIGAGFRVHVSPLYEQRD